MPNIHQMIKMRQLLMLAAFILVSSPVSAQGIYRCQGKSGATAYQDYPCEQATSNQRQSAAPTNALYRIVSEIKVNSLRVRQVRVKSAHCKAGTYDQLELVGPIGPDASEIVDRALEKLPRCENIRSPGYGAPIVFLVSGGGELEQGYKLGHILRKYGAETMVPADEVCASACAVAFLGGKYRTIDHNGRLLFHSPYLKSGEAMFCPEKSQIPGLKLYFTQFLGPKDGEFLFDRTMAFCSQKGGWIINSDAAKLLGITTN